MVERAITGPVNNPGRSDGELRSVQVFTSTGGNTWTKPVGLVRVVVELVSGGGGGGGTPNADNNIGAGGGGGGYAKELLEANALGVTETATVGAGGTAGNAAQGTGGSGGTSSFGSLLSATGGTGGVGVSSGGGAGGVGSGGDINRIGQVGGTGGAEVDRTGHGGDSEMGHGAYILGSAIAGDAGVAHGGAGSGGHRGTTTDRGGGAGADGIVIVWEYFR